MTFQLQQLKLKVTRWVVEIEVNPTVLSFKSRYLIVYFSSIYLTVQLVQRKFSPFSCSTVIMMKKFEIPVWEVSHHLFGSKTYLATHLSNLLVNAQISNKTIYIFFWLVVIKDYKVRHFWLLKRGRPVKSLLIVKSWTQKRLVCELETLERIDWANDEKIRPIISLRECKFTKQSLETSAFRSMWW